MAVQIAETRIGSGALGIGPSESYVNKPGLREEKLKIDLDGLMGIPRIQSCVIQRKSGMEFSRPVYLQVTGILENPATDPEVRKDAEQRLELFDHLSDKDAVVNGDVVVIFDPYGHQIAQSTYTKMENIAK